MNKIIVIGCPGSGKSTFSKILQSKTGLQLFNLDMLFWNADKTHITREEFDKRLDEILNLDHWIIDGNYSRTLEKRINACDTIYLLDLPVDDCILGVKSRIGKARTDMPWIEDELDEEFKNWIIDFPNKELPHIYSMFKKYNYKNIIIFKSHNEKNKYLGDL